MWAAAVDCRGPHADESDPSAGVYAAVRPTVTLLTPIDEPPPRPSGPERSRLRPDNPAALLRQAKAAVRRELWAVGAFSLFLNLLMLVSSIYMMEVFDRVMSSGSRETLFFLTLIALGATAVFGLLSNVRRKLLTPDRRLARARARRPGDRRQRWMPGSGAVAAMAGRRAGRSPTSRRSLPARAWLPSSTHPGRPCSWPSIGLLHPALGLFALVSAVLLLLCALANEALDPVRYRGRIGGRSPGAAAGRGVRQPGRAGRRHGHAHRAPAPLARRPAGGQRAGARGRRPERGARQPGPVPPLRAAARHHGPGRLARARPLPDLGRDDRRLRPAVPRPGPGRPCAAGLEGVRQPRAPGHGA